MKEEPPSIIAEPGRLGIRKKIKNRIKEIYQNFSYKPKTKQELAGSIRDSSERGVLEKGTLDMIEGALRVSTDQVRDIMIPRPQMVFVDSEESPEEFLPRVVKSSHSRFPVINADSDEIEGIVRWPRTIKQVEKFDSVAFKENNPEMYDSFTKPITYSVTPKVSMCRPYNLDN